MLKYSQLFLTDLMKQSKISVPSQPLDSADSITYIFNSIIPSDIYCKHLLFI